MKKTVLTTADGSHTLHPPEWGESRRSIHGAIQKALHLFISAGLNAFLTFLTTEKRRQAINYTALEKYPISRAKWQAMNHPSQLGAEDFHQVHRRLFEASWNRLTTLSDRFRLEKIQTDLIGFTTTKSFDLVYFDAFSPQIQPELWEKEIFENIYAMMNNGGSLVTYSVKGSVYRTLQEVGFTIEKHPGPPGKREMSRA